jgi:hypothetical protein
MMRFNIVGETNGGRFYFNVSAPSRDIALAKAARKIRESARSNIQIHNITAYQIRNGKYETYPYRD